MYDGPSSLFISCCFQSGSQLAVGTKEDVWKSCEGVAVFNTLSFEEIDMLEGAEVLAWIEVFRVLESTAEPWFPIKTSLQKIS